MDQLKAGPPPGKLEEHDFTLLQFGRSSEELAHVISLS